MRTFAQRKLDKHAPAVTSLKRDPLLDQLVNTFMKSGDKSLAERITSSALCSIQSLTHKNPVAILYDAVDKAAPLMGLKSVKKSSKVLHVPRPYNERQRRRKALMWIIEAADKRSERGIENRLSSEILEVISGTSGVLQKKLQLHKQVLANRSNIQT
ncbi:ribosomal protein S7 [Ramicandelaber brevisporus]|nr:ribosomal protein S7 [Ramicandelaber brevisporus]